MRYLLALAFVILATPGLAQQKPAVCFAPGTSQEYVNEVTSRYAAGPDPLFQTGSDIAEFQLDSRWSTTATNGSGLGQGDPTILTWSYIPDGTNISGFVGEPAAPSNLFAWLNGLYGSFEAWHALFVQVFDRWSQLAGITYVYQPTDDGAVFPSASGILGVRGDVRIGGHFIDGGFGTLAYNFFPNTGDMVIDTFDAYFNSTGSNSLRLRNTLAHEHGHGIGLEHVCPVNGTKLMEPFLGTGFDGPQIDDILGGQRGYGDANEHNDTSASATDLGFFAPGGNTFEDALSIDDNSDVNYFAFGTGANQEASVTLSPNIAAPYLEGPQNPNGSCTAGTLFDPTLIHDLAVAILDSDGTTVLASADASGVGGDESLVEIPLPSGAGTYFVRVLGDSTNDVQGYTLSLAVDAEVTPTPTPSATPTATPTTTPTPTPGPVPDIQILQSVLDFGIIEVGSSHEIRLRIDNVGSADLLVTATTSSNVPVFVTRISQATLPAGMGLLAILGVLHRGRGGRSRAQRGWLTMVAVTGLIAAVVLPDPTEAARARLTLEIPPGEAREVPVTFSPDAPTTYSETLTIVNNDPDEDPVIVTLLGAGI
jgi:hypothetical protein